jgi:hypothetical protein
MSARRAKGWFYLGWTTLGLLAALTVLTARASVVRCDATLREVPEPDSWHDWPLSAGAAHFEICPDGSPTAAHLVGWVEGGNVWVRAKGRTFVVAAAPRADEAPHERFVSAFRAELGGRYAFASRAGMFALIGLVSSLLVVLGGLSVGRARLRREPATRGKSPSLAPYRQGARADEAAGERHEASRTQGAIGAVRVALLLGAALFGLGAVAGGWSLVREVFRNLP